MHLRLAMENNGKLLLALPINDHVTYQQPMARNDAGNDVTLTSIAITQKLHVIRSHIGLG